MLMNFSIKRRTVPKHVTAEHVTKDVTIRWNLRDMYSAEFVKISKHRQAFMLYRTTLCYLVYTRN